MPSSFALGTKLVLVAFFLCQISQKEMSNNELGHMLTFKIDISSQKQVLIFPFFSSLWTSQKDRDCITSSMSKVCCYLLFMF